MELAVYHNTDGKITSDASSVQNMEPENLVITVMEGGKSVLYHQIIRFPSERNPLNQWSLPAGYKMADCIPWWYKRYNSLAHELGIDKPNYRCSGPRKNLVHGDLYLLDTMTLFKDYLERPINEGKGYEQFLFDNIHRQLQALMREPHPVIMASPAISHTRWEIPGTVEDHIQLLLNAGFKPLKKGSDWYYFTK